MINSSGECCLPNVPNDQLRQIDVAKRLHRKRGDAREPGAVWVCEVPVGCGGSSGAEDQHHPVGLRPRRVRVILHGGYMLQICCHKGNVLLHSYFISTKVFNCIWFDSPWKAYQFVVNMRHWFHCFLNW